MTNLFRKKAALYCCLPTSEHFGMSLEQQSSLLQQQKDTLIQFVKRNGWQIYDIYTDQPVPVTISNHTITDFTSDFDRPEFTRLYQDAEAHLFDIIICQSLNCFSHTAEITAKIIEQDLPRWGVRFIALKDLDHSDQDTPVSEDSQLCNLLLHTSIMQDWFLDDMLEQFNHEKYCLKYDMSCQQTTIPFGYTLDTNQDKKYIIDKPAAKIVQFIFNMFSSGISISEIAACLRKKKIPAPSVCTLDANCHGSTDYCPNTYWHEYTILSILKNSIYHGEFIQPVQENEPNKLEFTIDHCSFPALISDALWKCVQEQLDPLVLNACC